MCLIVINIPLFSEPSKKEKFINKFSGYINKYEGQSKELFPSCYVENSIMVNENLVFYFLPRVYNGLEDLAETIMTVANCHSTRITVAVKDNSDFSKPEPVCLHRNYKTKFGWRF